MLKHAGRALAALSLAAPVGGAFAADAAFQDFIGAAVRDRPRYEGSGERRTDLVPLLSYERGPWFARSTQGVLEGGARLALAEGVTAGAQFAYEAGPLDENPGASAGLQLEATGRVGPAPVNGLLRARQHLDADRGAALDARVNLGVYGGHGLRVGVFGQATWASDDHLRAYYGVAEDGLFFASGGAFGTYDLTARWALMGSAELRRLGGTPAASGVVADRSNEFVSLGVAYRF